MMGQKKVEIFLVKIRKSLAKQFLEVAISNKRKIIELFYDILGNYYVLKKTFKPKSPIGNIKEITLSISTERPLKRCFVKTPIFS